MQEHHTSLGTHLIADFYGATSLIDPIPVLEVLTQASAAAGATVLEVKTHDFGSRAGFTGVALLAESHISIHTWPEYNYAAIDIFMCGDADPLLSLKMLEAYFAPIRTELQVIERGMPRHAAEKLSAIAI